LGTTAYEIGIAMLIGGLSGLVVGLLLGGSKFMSRAYEAYLYYLGPCPKIIFFPLMIMWFGVGPGSKVAMGAIPASFRWRSTSPAGCARSTRFSSASARVSAPIPGKWSAKSIFRPCATR